MPTSSPESLKWSRLCCAIRLLARRCAESSDEMPYSKHLQHKAASWWSSQAMTTYIGKGFFRGSREVGEDMKTDNGVQGLGDENWSFCC